jgi:hypothetical protein
MLAGKGEAKVFPNLPSYFVLCREKRKKFSLFDNLEHGLLRRPVSRNTTKPL